MIAGRKRLRISLLLLLASSAVAADSKRDWALGSCDEAALAESRARAEARVRGAEKGSAEWVPYPYPTMPEQIVENVLASHRRAFSDVVASELPEADRRFFALADQGGLRPEIVRVADWTPNRCDPRMPRYGDWLVRFFAADGEEVTRVLVHDNGLIGRLRHASASYRFPPLPELGAPESFGSKLSPAEQASGQYVALWGPHACDAISPCPAWRFRGGVVVLRGEEWLRVDEDSERISFAGELLGDAKSATVDRVAREGRQLISLGGDLWVAAERWSPSSRSNGP